MAHSKPTLNYPSNTPIQELSTQETLMLMTLRLWCLPHRNPERSYPDWRTGIIQSGAGDQACCAMDALMNIIIHYSNRLLDIRCACNQRMGHDEGWFLQTLALLQANQHHKAEAILQDWLPSTVHGMALMNAMHLAENLRKENILIPLYVRSPAKIFQFADFYQQRLQNESIQKTHLELH